MTADVIKQSPKPESALNAVMRAAIRLRCVVDRCVVDTDLIRRAADALEKEKKH
jgi:hypothetical protein